MSTDANAAALTPEQIVEKRAKEAESWPESIEKDLFVRYGMTQAKWAECQRNYFPYNTRLELIVGAPLIFPLAYLIFSMDNLESLKTVVQTICVSLLGFYTTDKLIEGFKGTLCAKGLFGKDLNKSGV